MHEGHTTDVFADTFYDGIHQLRYRRRGEGSTSAVWSLMEAVYEGRRDRSVCGDTVTMHRSYACKELISTFVELGLGVVAIMLELKNAHPLVAALHLDPKNDALDDDWGSPPAKRMPTTMGSSQIHR